MTILQIILLTVSLVMWVRQVILIARVNTVMARYGAVKIHPSWWLHLAATVALTVASILSLTGIRA